MRFQDYAKRTAKGAISVRDGILSYLGSEIGQLPADQTFKVYRSPATIGNAEKLFIDLPVVDGHVDWDEKTRAFDTTKVIGKIISSEFINHRDPGTETILGVRNQIEFNDEEQRQGQELSLGYDANIVPSTDATLYDFIQENITPHHLAVVDAGRCGPTCKILDAMSTKTKTTKVPDAAAVAAAEAAKTTETSEEAQISDAQCDTIFAKFEAWMDKKAKDMEKEEEMKDEEEEMKDEDEEEMKDEDEKETKGLMNKDKAKDAKPASIRYRDSLDAGGYSRIFDKCREIGVEIKGTVNNATTFAAMRDHVTTVVGEPAAKFTDAVVHASFLSMQPTKTTGLYTKFGDLDGTAEKKDTKSPYDGQVIKSTVKLGDKAVSSWDFLRNHSRTH